MTAPETWRVVLEDGSVRSVEVRPFEIAAWDRFAAHPEGEGGTGGDGRTRRVAVLHLAQMRAWPVVEILAPNERSRAGLFAAIETRGAVIGAVFRAVGAECDDAQSLAEATRLAIEAARREGAEAMREAAAELALDLDVIRRIRALPLPEVTP